MNAAPAGATIEVCPGTYPENVYVERDLTLVGAGEAQTVIDGGGLGWTVHAFHTSLVLRDLAVVDGVGGVYLEGVFGLGHTLTTERVAISDNLDRGIRAYSGTLSLVDTTLARNVGVNGAAVDLLYSDLTLERCLVEDNVATSQGGALVLDQSSAVDTDSVFRRNTAATGGGAFLRGTVSTLELVGSDWATGMADENVPDDVACTADSIGWLGVGVSVTCTNLSTGCSCQ
ncbi:MAG: hypothetical protein R3F59_03050 [Myxococcota bacterium]